MKKKKHFPEPLQLVTRKKRDFFKALSKNPNLIKEVTEMNQITAKVLENKDKIRAVTIDEWVDRVFSIIPEIYNNEENLDLLKNFAKTLKESDTDDSYNERKGSNYE
jgi:pyruvate-formate lyase-activating enzyme